MSLRHSEVVIVLGAGRGSRMGVPKALMRVDGVVWWLRQLEAIEASGRPSVWVVSDRVREEIGEELAGRARVARGDQDAPMFTSLLAGIEAAGDVDPIGVFVLPVDVPLAGGSVLDALVAASGTIEDGIENPVSVPQYQGTHGHPVWMEWSWFGHALAGRNDDRLDSLTSDVRRFVDVEDARVAMNLNRPGDLEEYEAYLRDQRR